MKALYSSISRQGVLIVTDGRADRYSLIGGLPMPPPLGAMSDPIFV